MNSLPEQISRLEADMGSQTESILHHILILPTSTLHSHIQRFPSKRLQNIHTNSLTTPHQSHQAPRCIHRFISPSMITYSIIASMQILDHYTLGISIASLSYSMTSWAIQIMQTEDLCSGASQTRGVGRMPLVCWLVT